MSTSVVTALKPSILTNSSQLRQMDLRSCKSERSFRWYVDSVSLPGDGGATACDCFTGVLVGVDARLKEASRLLMVSG